MVNGHAKHDPASQEKFKIKNCNNVLSYRFLVGFAIL